MIPNNLVERVEEVFEEVGGYKGAAQILTDIEIIDCCLFNGYTDIVFPFYQGFSDDVLNGISIYTAVDLSVMGYKPGTTYSVVDKNYNVLYEEVATSIIQNQHTVHVFGLSDKDKTFLGTTAHGDLIYVKYETLEGPNIAQIIVSHRLPQSIINLNKKRWDRQIAELLEPDELISELVLDLNGFTNLQIFYLQGDLRDNYSEVKVVHSVSTVIGQQGHNTDFYLTFSKSTWFSIRQYATDSSLDSISLVGLDLEEANTELEGLGYSLVVNVGNGKYVFNKQVIEDPIPANPWYQEVVLAIGDNGQVVYATTAKYKVLKLVNLLGIGSEKLKLINNAYLLNLVTQEVNLTSNLDTGSNQPQPLMIRTQFKVQAKVNDV